MINDDIKIAIDKIKREIAKNDRTLSKTRNELINFNKLWKDFVDNEINLLAIDNSINTYKQIEYQGLHANIPLKGFWRWKKIGCDMDELRKIIRENYNDTMIYTRHYSNVKVLQNKINDLLDKQAKLNQSLQLITNPKIMKDFKKTTVFKTQVTKYNEDTRGISGTDFFIIYHDFYGDNIKDENTSSGSKSDDIIVTRSEPVNDGFKTGGSLTSDAFKTGGLIGGLESFKTGGDETSYNLPPDSISEKNMGQFS